ERWRGVQQVAASYNRPRAGVLTTAVLVIIAVLFVQTSRQPQQAAFALLEKPPENLDEAQQLLTQEDELREGLLNAYLSRQRYVSAQGEVRHISEMYQWAFDISDEQAQRVQQLYESVARPVLYVPIEPTPPDSTFAIVRAVRSTWMADQARAGWQAVADREVLRPRQEVNVTEHGDWAEVELYEVYQNQTMQRQEVVYYFSLPETAVITGVWLGNNDNRDERFTYRVAPRGAAQQTYQQEVQRRIDPALVEQIGPSQYRLRAFPVLPQGWEWNETRTRSDIVEGRPLHLWLTYPVLADGDAWSLPYLDEKRNVYWTDDTVRLVNGAAMADVNDDTWLPTAVPATTPITPAAHRVDFPDGQTVLIQPETAVTLPTPPDDLKLAIVLDRSRSMVQLADQTEAALNQLAAYGSADLYLTASSFRGESPSRATLADFDPAGIVYYGGQNAADLLVQFAQLQRGETYDAILVLTDGTGYGLSEGDVPVPVPDAPVWMIHLDGRFPIGYDDATLQAIQASGGGTGGSVDEALTRLLVPNGDIVNGYALTVLPTNQVTGEFIAHAPSDDFAALAARQLILHQMAQNRASITDLATLDALHALAVEQGIITPYSSMIVLITEQQQSRLDALEGRDDRFEREFEDVGETNQLTVTGVPEPEEWLLIGLAAVMLGWFVYSSRQDTSPKRLV
ncbi:MAG: TIGR02921 family PEP-CTERM protein, partial [Anaerolineae bacterium]